MPSKGEDGMRLELSADIDLEAVLTYCRAVERANGMRRAVAEHPDQQQLPQAPPFRAGDKAAKNFSCAVVILPLVV